MKKTYFNKRRAHILMKFLPISQENIPTILEAYKKAFPLSPRSQEKLTLYFKNNALGFFSIEDEMITGFIWGKFKPEKKIFNLNTLWVSESQRGKGYAKKFMEKLLISIEKYPLATEKIILHFREQNNLVAFYSKFGFIDKGIVGNYSNGDSKHSMEMIVCQE